MSGLHLEPVRTKPSLEADIMNPKIAKLVAILIVLVAMPVAISFARDAAGRPSDSGAAAEDVAIKQVVAGFSDGWNTHDAHSMCLSLADDVQWVSWRGDVSHSRKQVEDDHAELFSGLYKNSHRNDNVKAIR